MLPGAGSGKDSGMRRLTEEMFEREILQTPGAAAVWFYERLCPKCAMTRPFVEEIEKKYKKKIRFFEAEISEEPALAARCGAGHRPGLSLCEGRQDPGLHEGGRRGGNAGKKDQGAAVRALLSRFFIVF